MWRTAFSLSTFITAAAAVVVLVGGAAGLNTSQFTSDLTKEITMSLVVNQLAILKSINESSSGCASRDMELRLWKEEASQQLQAMEDSLRGMAEDAQASMHNMTEETRDNLRGMIEGAQSRMQVVEEVVKARQQAEEEAVQAQQQAVQARQQEVQARQQVMMELVQEVQVVQARQQAMMEAVQAQQQAMEEAVQAQQQAVEEAVQAQQQAQQQAVEAVEARLQNTINVLRRQAAMQAFHNDTTPSYCNRTGPRKVLHGSRGTLYGLVSRGSCSWRVVLPEGTKPFFTWDYVGDERNCISCLCGRVDVYEVLDGGETRWLGYGCYKSYPTLDLLNRITTNQFIVDILGGRASGRIGLYYQAVPT